jgi:hypothetical protein
MTDYNLTTSICKACRTTMNFEKRSYDAKNCKEVNYE